jgi:hypothetical protein
MSQRCHAQRAAGQYEVRRQRDQFRRVSAIAIDIVLAPAGVDPDIAAVAPSQLLQALLERRQLDLAAWIVRGPVHEHTEPPHPLGLLRARRERPHCRRAGKDGDEVAPPHSITSLACASRLGGTVIPIALAVDRLMTSSNWVGWTTGMSAGFSPLRMRPV